MATAKKEDDASSAPAEEVLITEETPVAVNPREVVKVKNISTRRINTSKGSMKPGESGKATVAELRQLHKFLEKE